MEDEGQIVVSMSQSAPSFGKKFTDLIHLADSLGLGRSAFSTGFDTLVVSTGVSYLLLPLIDQAAVDGAIPDARKLTAILEDADGEGCYYFSLDSNSADAVAHVAKTVSTGKRKPLSPSVYMGFRGSNRCGDGGI
ncbi:PhzF family phenazine biosynthesis protein [Cryobacterium sp. M15]|uniref:PhzF family phenazine biosynthesis protein n=1 Tax=Cryobacterium sp. M15 TaxID=2048291 RepID=UPI000CE2C4CF|nr:PhzF family phenazine biosynthesis protein [Cryobacterium sp. M15]